MVVHPPQQRTRLLAAHTERFALCIITLGAVQTLRTHGGLLAANDRHGPKKHQANRPRKYHRMVDLSFRDWLHAECPRRQIFDPTSNARSAAKTDSGRQLIDCRRLPAICQNNNQSQAQCSVWDAVGGGGNRDKATVMRRTWDGATAGHNTTLITLKTTHAPS